MRFSQPVLLPLLLKSLYQEEPEGASSHERAQDLWGEGTSRGLFLAIHIAQKNQIISTSVLLKEARGRRLIDRQRRLLDLTVPSGQQLK